MVTYNELYVETHKTGAINASASETLGADRASQVHRDRYGSSNSLVLTSLADEDFHIFLDGVDARLAGILYTRGSFIIKPEDGIFFNSVKLTNVSATNASANEVVCRIARAVPV